MAPKKKVIALISDDFFPAQTGVGVHVQVLARELSRRGHRVLVLTSRPKKGLPDLDEWEGIRVYRMPTWTIAGFPQALPLRRRVRRILRAERPDILHFHYFSWMLRITLAAAGSLRIPKVLTYHFSPEVLTQPLFLRPFRRLIHSLVQSVYARFDLILFPSQGALEAVRESMRERTRIPPMLYITNPLALSGIMPGQQVRGSRPGFRVLYAGRLAVEKNIPLLLRAVSRVKEKVQGLELWIAGEGPLRSDLKALAQELGILELTRFLGFLDHEALAKRYAGCDLFVLPSVIETLSLVAIEAMAYGKPLIVTDRIVAAQELVREGRNGFIVDAESEEELAQRILELASHPIQRARMGDESLVLAREYEPAGVIDRLKEAYSSL